ncbi:discoidin domain-containing protein [Cohnella silvisoli]|uniref:Discoidin domain-containing protein n=1 Tax=Cohnella silvisoli TaxID=2873699 RepID=A0ABV1L0A2_9BACL|nr:discoidin domain-containing protein [Cohnella silvisoli]MCD9024876.1 discoidin domain-containing protein [Cohnella silvisoli]
MFMPTVRKSLVWCLAMVIIFTVVSASHPRIAVAAIQASYYVNPTGGNDSNDGTSAATAFATLTKARDAVRIVNGNMTGDIYIYLMNGTHSLSGTLTLGVSDSGTNGYNVIYKAYDGSAPVVSGGVDITDGWTLYDSAKNIYKKTGINWSFRQLYVNEQRGIKARQPNLTDEITGAPYLTATNNSYPYTVNPSDIGTWANGGTAEMVVINHWSQYRGRIANYSGSTVNFKSPESGFAWNHHNQATTYYYFENALALLDSGGEWFLDSANTTLYYKPRAGETMNTTPIFAPKVETLVKIEGTDAAHKANHIQFCGIVFKYSNWIAPNNYGYVDVQAGFRYQTVSGGSNANAAGTARYATVLGAIQLKYTSNIALDHNTFMFNGGWGVMGNEGTDHTSVASNTFLKNAGGAVALGITGNEFAEMPSQQGQSLYDSITRNTINANSLDYADMVGIGAMLPANMTIDGNEVKNLPYTGITIGWEWDDLDHGMTNNQVTNNHVHDVIKLLDDGAGIYSLGKMTGNSKFHHNYIHNLSPSAYSGGYAIAAIYFDNGSVGKTADYNVLNNTTNAWYAFNPPNYSNLFQNSYYNAAAGSWANGNTFQNNTAVTNQNWPQAAIDIMNGAGPNPNATVTLVNRALNGTASASTVYGTGYEPGKAIDGLGGTLWSPTGADSLPWLQIDLGAAYRLNQIHVVDRQDTTDYRLTRQNFEIRASNDPSFTTFAVLGGLGATPYPFHGTWSMNVVDSMAYRYVRVAKTVNEYFTVGELQIMCDVNNPPLINRALSGTASASSFYGTGNEASKANDGLVGTLWSPTGADASPRLQVDLGAAYYLKQISLVDRQDTTNYGQTRQNFEIRASNDPTFATYTVLGGLGATPYPFHGTWTTAVSDATAYRYVRAAKTVSEYFTIAELQILSN